MGLFGSRGPLWDFCQSRSVVCMSGCVCVPVFSSDCEVVRWGMAKHAGGALLPSGYASHSRSCFACLQFSAERQWMPAIAARPSSRHPELGKWRRSPSPVSRPGDVKINFGCTSAQTFVFLPHKNAPNVRRSIARPNVSQVFMAQTWWVRNCACLVLRRIFLRRCTNRT